MNVKRMMVCLVFVFTFVAPAFSGTTDYSSLPLEDYQGFLDIIKKNGIPVTNPDTPPLQFVTVSGNYTLTPGDDKLSVSGRVVIKKLVESFSVIPLSLHTFRFEKAIIGDKNAPLFFGVNGEPSLLLKEKGKYVFVFSGSMPLGQRKKNLRRASVTLPPSGIRKISFNNKRSRNAYHTRSVSRDGRETVHVTWVPTARSGERRTVSDQVLEKKISCEMDQLVVVAENYLNGVIQVSLKTENLKDEPLIIEHPPWIEMLKTFNPQPEVPLSLEPVSDTLTRVYPAVFWPSSMSFGLSYSQKNSDTSSKVIVPVIRILNARPWVLKVGITAQNVRLLPKTIRKAGMIDPAFLALPGGSSVSQVIFAFKSIHPDFLVELERHPIPLTPVVTGTCKKALTRLIRTNDGQGIIQSVYLVKSTNLPFFNMRLPENGRVFSIFSDGKPVKAGITGDETVKIPLIASTSEKENRVEIWMDIPRNKFGLLQLRRQDFPEIDLPTEKSEYRFLYPVDVYPVYFTGNIETLPAPRRTGGKARVIFRVLVSVIFFVLLMLWKLIKLLFFLILLAAAGYLVYRLIKIIPAYASRYKTSLLFLVIGGLLTFVFLSVFVALGPQIKNMFEKTVDSDGVGKGQVAISAATYGGGEVAGRYYFDKNGRKKVRKWSARKAPAQIKKRPAAKASRARPAASKPQPRLMKQEEFFRDEVSANKEKVRKPQGKSLGSGKNLSAGVLPVKFNMPATGIAYTAYEYFPERNKKYITVISASKYTVKFFNLLFLFFGAYLGFLNYAGKYRSKLQRFNILLAAIIVSYCTSYFFSAVLLNAIAAFFAAWLGPCCYKYIKNKYRSHQTPEVLR